MRFLLLLFAGVSVGLVAAFSAAIRRPMVRALRAMMLSLSVMLALSGTLIGATGLESGSLLISMFGAFLLLAALRLGWALRRQSLDDEEYSAALRVPLTRPQRDPHWARFEARLDWVGRQQARRARTAIGGFVAEKDSDSLTFDHRALLLSCEKRVPELLDACFERCRNASPQERRRYVDETLDHLVRIAAKAERARTEIRDADDRRLEVLHRYFDDVAGKDERAGPP